MTVAVTNIDYNYGVGNGTNTYGLSTAFVAGNFYIVTVWDSGNIQSTITGSAPVTWTSYDPVLGGTTNGSNVYLLYGTATATGTYSWWINSPGSDVDTTGIDAYIVDTVTGVTSAIVTQKVKGYGTTSPLSSSALSSSPTLTYLTACSCTSSSVALKTGYVAAKTAFSSGNNNFISGYNILGDTTPNVTFSGTTYAGSDILAVSIISNAAPATVTPPVLTQTQTLYLPTETGVGIQYVGGATGTNTCTVPTHSIGDLILISAFRKGSTTAPTLASGFTSIYSTGANTVGLQVAYRIATATNDTSGTWTNATELVCQVYTGTHTTSPIGNSATASQSSTTVTYPTVSLTDATGNSWVAGFVGHTSIDTSLSTAPTGMTNKTNQLDANAQTVGCDTNRGVISWATQTVSVGGTSAGWISATVELKVNVAAPQKTFTFTCSEASTFANGVRRTRPVLTTDSQSITDSFVGKRTRNVLATDTLASTLSLSSTRTRAFINTNAETQSLSVFFGNQTPFNGTITEASTLGLTTIGRTRKIVQTSSETQTNTNSTLNRLRAASLLVNESEVLTAALGKLKAVAVTLSETFGFTYNLTVNRLKLMVPTITEVSSASYSTLTRIRQTTHTINETLTYVEALIRTRKYGLSDTELNALNATINATRKMSATLGLVETDTIALGRQKKVAATIAELETISASITKIKLMAYVIAQTETNTGYFLNRARQAIVTDAEFNNVVASFNRARILIDTISEAQTVNVNWGRIRKQIVSISETQGVSAALGRIKVLLQSISNALNVSFTIYTSMASAYPPVQCLVSWTEIVNGITVSKSQTVNFGSEYSATIVQLDQPSVTIINPQNTL